MSKALQKAAALEASLKKQRLEEELLNDTFNTSPNDDNTTGGNAGYISLKKESQSKTTKKDLDDVSDDDMAIDSSSQTNRKISKFERKQAKKQSSNTQSQATTNKYNFPKNAKKSAVLYVGHIPHGFYEDQMKAFLSQFGEIVALRISRSRRTGRSKGYGFVQFEDPEIAKVVAETMDNYILEEKTMQFRQLPVDRLHPKMFLESNIRRAVISWRKEAREMHNRQRTIFEQEKQLKNLKKRDQKKAKQLAALGIDYKFDSGYNNQVADAMAKIKALKTKARELGLAGALLGEYTGDTDGEEDSDNANIGEEGDEMEIIECSDLDSIDTDEDEENSNDEDEDDQSDNDDEKDESLLRGEEIFLGKIKPMHVKRNDKGEITFSDEESQEEVDSKEKKSTPIEKKRKAKHQDEEEITEQSPSKKVKQNNNKLTKGKVNKKADVSEEESQKLETTTLKAQPKEKSTKSSTKKDKTQETSTDKSTRGKAQAKVEKTNLRSSPRRTSARLSGKK